jgi:hypothetical protein
MEKNIFKNILRFFFIAGLLYISGCSKYSNQENGILAGTISIGPICPVETIPPDPGCLPTAETYKAYPVYIWAADGSKKIALISPALDGSFRTDLAPGNYLISLEKGKNGIGSNNLPQEVTISPLVKTVISIVIDTGIR